MNVLQNHNLRIKTELVFKLLFLFYAMLGACNLTYSTKIISFFLYPTVLLGGLLILWRLILAKRFLKTPELPWLLALLASNLFSVLTNLRFLDRDGIKSSIITLILWSFYFLLLFMQDPERSRDSIQREFRIFAAIQLIYTTLLILISLWMLITGYSMSYKDPGNHNYEVASGFFSGRLWGAFQDPNFGAALSCVSIVIAVYFIWYFRKKLLTVLLSVDIVLMVFYLALSDSRNGMVCTGGIAGAALFFWLFRKYGKAELLKKAACLALVIVSMLGGICLPELVQKGYNAIILAQSDTTEETPGSSLVIERPYDLVEDVSNRRLDIWKSGAEIALSRPLTGVSFAGMVPYAKEYMPDTYIVSNGIWDFNTLDNEILNIFAAQGFPGLILVLILAFTCLWRIITRIWKVEQHDFPVVYVCTIIVVVLAVSALFQGTMFYQHTPNANIFWAFLGYLIYLLPDHKKRPVLSRKRKTV